MAEHLKKCNGLSDKELMRKAMSEIDYFGCLFHRYENKMLHYILKISSCSNEEAQDILQEAFIKIWKNLHNFDTSLSFSSWLYRIVHNETISQWRKSKTRGVQLKTHIDDISYFNNLIQDVEYDLDKEVDVAKVVNNVLEKMKSDYRDILILKYFENLSYEEISDVLRIPEGTVATRINRAKKSFLKESNKLNH